MFRGFFLLYMYNSIKTIQSMIVVTERWLNQILDDIPSKTDKIFYCTHKIRVSPYIMNGFCKTGVNSINIYLNMFATHEPDLLSSTNVSNMLMHMSFFKL